MRVYSGGHPADHRPAGLRISGEPATAGTGSPGSFALIMINSYVQKALGVMHSTLSRNTVRET